MRRDLALMFATTILSYPLGLLLRSPWLLPVLNALPAYAVLVYRLRRGERGGAVRAMLWWALAVALTATILFEWWPRPIEGVVLQGASYKAAMFQWIRTGHGAEGTPRLFLPGRLLQLAAFILLGALTAGAGAVVMGAVLMNYMAYYVASLARAGLTPWAVTLLGWQPWAVARICAFCTLGVLMAEPLLFRLFPAGRTRLKTMGRGAYVVAAMSWILTDWFLQALLAPFWGRWLHRLLP